MFRNLVGLRALRRAATVFALTCAALVAVTAATRAAGETDGPAIWKASRGNATVFLFGTIHILEPGQDWFTPKIESRFARAHTLVLEMADIRGSGEEAARMVRQLGAYPPRDSLARHLGERTYMHLQSTMSRLGAPPVALYRMRPWVALMVFSTHALAADGRLLEYGADRTLHARALKQKKRVIGLETMEAHLRSLADMPELVQIEMLTDSLNSLNRLNPLYRPLVDAWLHGDVEELGRLMAADMSDGSPLVRQRILIDRNHNWITPIERMLREGGTYFIAAGAAHFAGEDDVIDLLRARGVTVVRE